MKNPFLDFQTVSHKKQEIPLNRIVRARQEAMHRILGGYLSLVEAEAKDFVWRVEQSRVLKTYDAAVKRIQGIHYDQDDIVRVPAVAGKRADPHGHLAGLGTFPGCSRDADLRRPPASG